MASAAIKGSAGFHRQGRSNAPRPLTREQRRRIEALVAFLIEVLDQDDGDPDLEPSLGWSRTYATTAFDTSPTTIDLEEGHDGCEPDPDLEPDVDAEPWVVPVSLNALF